MRSRYSAFALGLGEYLVRTGDHDESAATLSEWARSVTWLGLEVKKVERGSIDDDEGHVTFVARYVEKGVEVSLEERSFFRRGADGWRYLSGETKVTQRRAMAVPVVT